MSAPTTVASGVLNIVPFLKVSVCLSPYLKCVKKAFVVPTTRNPRWVSPRESGIIQPTCRLFFSAATLCHSIPFVGVPMLNTEESNKFSCPLGAPTIRSTPDTVLVKLLFTCVLIISTQSSKLILMVILISVNSAVLRLRFKLSSAILPNMITLPSTVYCLCPTSH